MNIDKIKHTHAPVSAIRILLAKVLQDIVDAISHNENSQRWVVEVRTMRLGQKRWERKEYTQTTLSDYFDLEVGEPENQADKYLYYTVNPRYLTDEYVTQIYEEILEDMTKVI